VPIFIDRCGLVERRGLSGIMLQREVRSMTENSTHPREHDDLTGEHPLADVGQLVLLGLFAGVWIADSFVLGWTTFLNGAVPLVIRVPIGAVLLALAGILAFSSHRIIFGETREIPCVVRTGVFSVVRHPMYLSEILLALGLLLMSLSPAATAVWLLAVGFLTYVARTEERLLLERFGDDYAEYKRDVGMWIPRGRSRR